MLPSKLKSVVNIPPRIMLGRGFNNLFVLRSLLISYSLNTVTHHHIW
jgi:hypothetical protein